MRPVAAYPQAPVRIFVMGANRWRDEQEWPLTRAKATNLYLGGRKNVVGRAWDGGVRTVHL